jgi:hypothetical protein
MSLRLSAVMIVLLYVSLALGQSGEDYILTWSTIDGGGGTSRGGQYVLTGTMGQPDAAYSASATYELLGGFWPGGPLCFVAFDDFAVFAELWLIGDLSGDLDNDEDIDFGDLQRLTDYWLSYCPYGWTLK